MKVIGDDDMAIIDMKNVSFQYTANQKALSNINLTIQRGEWVSILGHNGSGKSTLSKLLIGLLKPSEGEIMVDNTLLNAETVYDVRRKIGIVFQNPDNQFVGVTVRDDIAFGLENLQVERKSMVDKIDFYAKKVGMYDFLDKEPSALSGGQKQRVAIAGILAMSTDIIIFDEATAMLDPKGRKMMLDYMKQLNQDGVTIITITHDMKEAVLSDRIIILKQGKIIKDDLSEAVLRDKHTLEQSNLQLLLPLDILFELEQLQLSNERIKEILWELSLNA